MMNEGAWDRDKSGTKGGRGPSGWFGSGWLVSTGLLMHSEMVEDPASEVVPVGHVTQISMLSGIAPSGKLPEYVLAGQGVCKCIVLQPSGT